MTKSKCEICGGYYTYSCTKCTKRISVWGEEGTLKLIELSKRKDDIQASELLEFVTNYYNGKTKISESVNTLKISLRLLGYSGKWVGRIHVCGKSYNSIRKRGNEAGRRYKLRNDSCDFCGSVDNLHLHHIVPISWGGLSSKENCITLCEKCHRKTHKELNKKLNTTLLLKYLEPHLEEIKSLANESINHN